MTDIPTYKLFNEDVFLGLRKLQDDSCDLCIVDPPYGASTTNNWSYGADCKVKGFGGDWKLTSEAWDLLTQNDSFLNTFEWLKELKRIIKPTGSIWIHSTYHNSGFVNVCCQLLGLEIINEIAWYKRNSFPNLSGRRLTASHETILWVHKGGEKNRKYIFNYNETKSFSAPYDMLKEAGKQMRTVWDIPNNKSKEEMQFGSHPTQKPIRVAERILLISGVENGSLLVPFAGSGTEMVAGINYGMNVVGFEINPEYFEIANKRLQNAISNKSNSIF
ncbi:MAG: site-specific DNA-methyltransferase [Muribaculaceae bacterium]|nr:site-specific DNA-methyltransferase [Muribaculaceae bacterium]